MASEIRWASYRGKQATFPGRGRDRVEGGRVTHEPPLRMAERSPAAKQSIYAFKMAARNATHPTISLYIPPHVTIVLTPLAPSLMVSLHPSHVCPRSSLTSGPSHWLPTRQYYSRSPSLSCHSSALFIVPRSLFPTLPVRLSALWFSLSACVRVYMLSSPSLSFSLSLCLSLYFVSSVFPLLEVSLQKITPRNRGIHRHVKYACIARGCNAKGKHARTILFFSHRRVAAMGEPGDLARENATGIGVKSYKDREITGAVNYRDDRWILK